MLLQASSKGPPVSAVVCVAGKVGSAPFIRCHYDCSASSAQTTNIQTYLLTYLITY